MKITLKTPITTTFLLAVLVTGAMAAETKTGQNSSPPAQSISGSTTKTLPAQSSGGSSSGSSGSSSSGSSRTSEGSGGAWARKAD